DKEGFLRSPRSLIQTIGRAARNAQGRVIMYADRITPAMKQAIDETDRRREVQRKYNETHGITPETVSRAILDVVTQSGERDYYAVSAGRRTEGDGAAAKARAGGLDEHELMERMQALRQEMFLAAENLQFEKAARLRDELKKLQAELGHESPQPSRLPQARAAGGRGARKAAAPRAAAAKKRPRSGSRARRGA
ncbi:MAG TPA: UvrB/UvrC motif-containing protein, partial [Polyangiaceae bacterium]|nr:UvrB/UvrC motif-containing protein [Polyangiaceae bacterium]